MSKKRIKPAHTNGTSMLPSAKLDRLQPPAKSLQPLVLGKDCDYDRELRRLQIELVKLQEWIRQSGLKVVVLFEGRDAAGKGARSSALPRARTLACAGWSHWVHPLSAKRRNGISGVMSPICPGRVNSCFLTAVGTTAPVWSV